MKWNNRLKEILAKKAKTEKTEECLEKALTKTDKTPVLIVSSVFVSDKLRHFPEKTKNIEVLPNCSKCDLEMMLIENNTLWFCPFGCESQKII